MLKIKWWLQMLLVLSLLGLALPVMGQASTSVAKVGVAQVEVTGDSFPNVKLKVLITDVDGQPVTNLEASAFSVTENQAAVSNLTVAPVSSPLAIGFVIDSSQSFNQRDGNPALPLVEHAKQAIRNYIDSGRLQNDDALALYAFKDGQPTELSNFTKDQGGVINAIDEVSTAGNVKTALFDIVRKSIDAAAVQPATRRVLLIFSDGLDTTSSLEIDKVIKRAQDANLTIYTIGLRVGANLAPDQENSKFLRRLALETGGQYLWYQPRLKDAAVQLTDFLNATATQRNLYDVSYSTTECSGKPSVRVVVTGGGASAETTTIYDIPQHKPQITLENVTRGQILKGVQMLKVGVACKQSPVTRVDFKLNGEVAYTDSVEPFEYEWNTEDIAKQLGATSTEPKQVTVSAVAVVGPYTAEASQIVGVVLPPPPVITREIIEAVVPCTTGPAVDNFVCRLQSGDIVAHMTIIGFIMALAAVILLIILIRRGGIRAVSAFAVDTARKVTKTFQRRTGIKGPNGAVIRPAGLATLVLESEPYMGKRIYIEEDNVFFGRVPERANIILDWDDYISGRHAKLVHEQGRFLIWDMQSANGTWVNDQRVPKSNSDGLDINEAREVPDGALIRLGPDLKLRFKVGTEQNVPSTPVAPIPSQPAIAAAPLAAAYRPGSTQVMRPDNAHAPVDDTLIAPSERQ